MGTEADPVGIGNADLLGNYVVNQSWKLIDRMSNNSVVAKGDRLCFKIFKRHHTAIGKCHNRQVWD